MPRKIIQEDLWGFGDVIELPEDDITSIVTKSKKKPKKVTAKKKKEVVFIEVFADELERCKAEVYRILGKYKDNTICIYSRDEFHDYITKSIENGVIAVDTETLGTRTDIPKPATDPFTCKLAGLCIYTPDMKNAYIPVNHVDYRTNIRLENQLTEQDIKEELQRIVDSNIKVIFQNGKFDYLVLRCTCDVILQITWDTLIGSQILNENELAGLKFQYKDKINKNQDKYDIEKLFDIEKMAYYPPELFALYAATDSYMTYMLYLYQLKEFEKKGNEKLYNLFKNIEMPIVTTTAKMQYRGVGIDIERGKRLSEKYHAKLDEVMTKIKYELTNYDDIIAEWKTTPEANEHPVKKRKVKGEIKESVQKSLAEKLSDPIDLNSPEQLGILLYDILHILKPDEEDKKKVDEETLLKIKDKLPLATLILKMREYEKYLGTYIDKLMSSEVLSPRDGRIHAKFNQLGREDKNVVTGRMSSSDPNLQNIPARGEIVTVRCMFVPTVEENEPKYNNGYYLVPITSEVMLEDKTYQWSSYLKPGDKIFTNDLIDGKLCATSKVVKSISVVGENVMIYVMSPTEDSKLLIRIRYQMLGSDYSAQEVRVFAASSHDSHMIKTYEEGKDLYADVASRVFKVPYEQCLEFNPITKEMQVEGKARRTKCKSLILGLLYGRGITSIAEQIKSHKEGAVTKEDIEEAKQLSKDFFDSYPEGKAWIDQTHADVKKYGYVEDLWGRRRRLPDINLPKYTFKLKDEDEKIDVNPFLFTPNIKKELNPLLVKKYEAELSKVKMKADREKIIEKAADEGLVIIDNSGYIAQAERQSVNARIQGGSATITKLAMRNMDNDDELNRMGFHLLIPVHDEVIAECPLWYIEECKKRMSEIMIHAAEPECCIKMKCDADDFPCWYYDVFSAHMVEDFDKLKKSGMDDNSALDYLYEENCEFTRDEIAEIVLK